MFSLGKKMHTRASLVEEMPETQTLFSGPALVEPVLDEALFCVSTERLGKQFKATWSEKGALH